MEIKPRTRTIAAVILLVSAGAFATAQILERGPTRNPHGKLDVPCSSCHTSTSWKPIRSIPEFNHDRQTGYPLRGMHQDVKCSLCHTNLVFTEVGMKCADCHADIHRRQFGARCEECHNVKGWRSAVQNMRAHQNRFPLLGAHAAVECEACHRGAATAVYTGLRTDCYSCHQKDYERATPIDHRAAGFPVACEQCHTMDTWLAANFDHARFTRFALSGAHTRLECASCHVGGRFQGVSADCSSCHNKDFVAAKNPDHVAAGFPQTCASCHTDATWSGAKFDHNTATPFQLTGAHVQVNCQACHVGGRFAGTPTACAGCHLNDFNNAANPNHKTAAFSQNCVTCHTTATWTGATFDHNLTAFKLDGAHARLDCATCHVGGKFTGTPNQCYGCHQSNFTSAQNPNHVTSGFPQDCTLCHTTVQWQPAAFDHSKTKFPLTGAHQPLDCNRCHIGNQFTGTPSQCVSCHLTDFNKSTNPSHVAAGFPQECAVCHTTTQWQGAKFDHNTATKFALTGAHQPLACTQCHANNRFAGTPSDCVGCHLTDFQKTTNPNHVSANFPQTCALCHTTVLWTGAVFDHSKTNFPLTGAHQPLDCALCHTNNVFTGTTRQCAGCHLDAFNKATSPNHVAAGFPQDCSLCHSTTLWTGAKFDHSQTRFPLAGAHASVQCASCHINNVFAGLGTACATCHLPRFNATTNPNHVSAGFPTQCEVCHTVNAWTPASFNHNTTKFPLTGKHVQVQCANCHIGGVFTGTPTDCFSCHKTVFQTVSNPNHISAGFPTTCATCHNTTAWTGATFTHSKFPIYSGNHNRGRAWTTCADCHANPANYTVFSCTNCHTHDKATTDSRHRNVRNYVYNSANCYACHPTGRGD